MVTTRSRHLLDGAASQLGEAVKDTKPPKLSKETDEVSAENQISSTAPTSGRSASANMPNKFKKIGRVAKATKNKFTSKKESPQPSVKQQHDSSRPEAEVRKVSPPAYITRRQHKKKTRRARASSEKTQANEQNIQAPSRVASETSESAKQNKNKPRQPKADPLRQIEQARAALVHIFGLSESVVEGMTEHLGDEPDAWTRYVAVFFLTRERQQQRKAAKTANPPKPDENDNDDEPQPPRPKRSRRGKANAKKGDSVPEMITTSTGRTNHQNVDSVKRRRAADDGESENASDQRQAKRPKISTGLTDQLVAANSTEFGHGAKCGFSELDPEANVTQEHASKKHKSSTSPTTTVSVNQAKEGETTDDTIAVERKPDEIEEKPQELEEKPKEVEAELKDLVAAKPKGVEEKSKEIEQNPKEFDEKPKELVEDPAVAQSKAPQKDTPGTGLKKTHEVAPASKKSAWNIFRGNQLPVSTFSTNSAASAKTSIAEDNGEREKRVKGSPKDKKVEFQDKAAGGAATAETAQTTETEGVSNKTQAESASAPTEKRKYFETLNPVRVVSQFFTKLRGGATEARKSDPDMEEPARKRQKRGDSAACTASAKKKAPTHNEIAAGPSVTKVGPEFDAEIGQRDTEDGRPPNKKRKCDDVESAELQTPALREYAAGISSQEATSENDPVKVKVKLKMKNMSDAEIDQIASHARKGFSTRKNVVGISSTGEILNEEENVNLPDNPRALTSLLLETLEYRKIGLKLFLVTSQARRQARESRNTGNASAVRSNSAPAEVSARNKSLVEEYSAQVGSSRAASSYADPPAINAEVESKEVDLAAPSSKQVDMSNEVDTSKVVSPDFVSTKVVSSDIASETAEAEVSSPINTETAELIAKRTRQAECARRRWERHQAEYTAARLERLQIGARIIELCEGREMTQEEFEKTTSEEAKKIVERFERRHGKLRESTAELNAVKVTQDVTKKASENSTKEFTGGTSDLEKPSERSTEGSIESSEDEKSSQKSNEKKSSAKAADGYQNKNPGRAPHRSTSHGESESVLGKKASEESIQKQIFGVEMVNTADNSEINRRENCFRRKPAKGTEEYEKERQEKRRARLERARVRHERVRAKQERVVARQEGVGAGRDDGEKWEKERREEKWKRSRTPLSEDEVRKEIDERRNKRKVHSSPVSYSDFVSRARGQCPLPAEVKRWCPCEPDRRCSCGRREKLEKSYQHNLSRNLEARHQQMIGPDPRYNPDSYEPQWVTEETEQGWYADPPTFNTSRGKRTPRDASYYQ